MGNNTFDRLSVELSGSKPFIENAFTRQWNSPAAFLLTIETPFHIGNLETGLEYNSYEKKETKTLGNFDSFFFFLGWNYPMLLTKRFSIKSGLHLGNMLMHFDKPKIYYSPNQTKKHFTKDNESEFTYEFYLGTQYRLFSRWVITASLSYQRTLTYHPISITSISGGVQYNFVSPDWIKKLLK